MVITPTLETLRFIGARIAEIRQQVANHIVISRSQDELFATSLITGVYAQQLAELVPVLHQAGQTPLALEVALSVPIPAVRCAALQYLGKIDQGSFELLREAFDTIREIASERERSQALVQLAGDLPLDLLADAVALARQISWRYGQVRVLQALAYQCADPDDRQALLDEALTAAHEIDDVEEAAEAILGLLPELGWQRADGEIQALLELIPYVTSEPVRTNLLFAITEQVRMWLNTNSVPIHVVIYRLNLLNRIVQESLPSETYHNQVVHAMLPAVAVQQRITWPISESLLRRAITELNMATQRGDWLQAFGDWLQAFADLLPLLEVDKLEDQASASHTNKEEHPDPHSDPRALIHLFATRIPPSVTPDVLRLVPHLPSHADQAELLRGLIPRLPKHQVDEALTLLQRLSEEIK